MDNRRIEIRNLKIVKIYHKVVLCLPLFFTAIGEYIIRYMRRAPGAVWIVGILYAIWAFWGYGMAKRFYMRRYSQRKYLIAYEKTKLHLNNVGERHACTMTGWVYLVGVCAYGCLTMRYRRPFQSILTESTTMVFLNIFYIILPLMGVVMSAAQLFFTTKTLFPATRHAVKHIHKTPFKKLDKENITLLFKQTEELKPCDEGLVEAEGKFGKKRVFQYLLSVSDIQNLYKNKVSAIEIKEKIEQWCCLMQTDSMEELNAEFDKIYQEYISVPGNSGLRTVVVVNYRPEGGEPLEIPAKYRQHAFFYYMEVYSLEEVTFTNIQKSKNREKGIYEKKTLLNEGYTEGYYFDNPREFLDKVNEKQTYNMNLTGGSLWLLHFYNSACTFQNNHRSAMALLDYQELLLRLVAGYYYLQHDGEKKYQEKDLIGGSILPLAYIIRDYSDVEPERRAKLLNQKYELNAFIRDYFKKLEPYFYIRFKGKEVSFMGLISIVQLIRNKIVAHGVLNRENVDIVWGILFWSTVVLNNFLDVAEFKLIEHEDGYEVGYEKTVDAGKYVIQKDHCPCIASAQKKNKTIYVNYFSGELITPSYVES